MYKINDRKAANPVAELSIKDTNPRFPQRITDKILNKVCIYTFHDFTSAFVKY